MNTFAKIGEFILDTLFCGAIVLLMSLCGLAIVMALWNVPQLLIIVAVVFVLGLVGKFFGFSDY